jgi:MFS family permease
MIGAFIPMVTVFGALQHNMVQIAADSGVDAARASWLISCFSGTMLAGKIFFGALADRTDLRILYVLSISLLAGAAMIFMTTPPFYLLVTAAGVLGLAAGGFLPLLGCIVSTRFGPHAFGRVMGLVGLFMLLAGLGPWFAGSLRDFAGDYDLVLQVFLVLLIPAVCAMLFLKPLPVPPRELAPGE